jgi:hypothetical protein
MAQEKRATPRVREHVDRLRAAGLDTARFFDALTRLRDDTALPKAHREAIYKLIAMESFVWYLEALRGEPIDREKLLEQAKALAEQPAIVKRTPGDQAAALASGDVGRSTQGTPPPAAPRAAATSSAAARPSAPPATTARPTPGAPTSAAPRAAPAPGPRPTAPSGGAPRTAPSKPPTPKK